MSEITDRIKEQFEELSGKVEQAVSAARGLVVKVKEDANSRFDELVAAGEAQAAAEAEGQDTIIEQIKTEVKEQLEDVKGSFDQLKSASLGLAVKAKEESNKYFNELVELGTKEEAEA